MAIWEWLSVLAFLLLNLGTTWYVARDAVERGMGRFHVIVLALTCVFFFPFAEIVYLAQRPAVWK